LRKQLKLYLREQPVGVEPTPKQSAQRDRFAVVAKECKEEFKDSKLRGEAKVRAMNAWVSKRLKG